MTRPRTRIVLVDDHVLVRGGIRALLEAKPDLEVTGEADDGEQGVKVVLAAQPDVVLMDLEMPVMDGIEATRRIKAAGSEARVLVVTNDADDELVLGALKAGATGFLLKDTDPDRLCDAVRAVANGDTLLARSIAEWLVESHLRAPLPTSFEYLTERERDVLLQLARGLSNAQVADRFGLSEGTVKTHVTRVLAKLGVRNRVQAVVLAYESGFVRPGRM